MGEGDLCKTNKTKKLKKFTQGGQDSRLIFKASEIKGTYKKIPHKKHWMLGMKELVDGAVQFLSVPEVRPHSTRWAESSFISKFFSWEHTKQSPNLSRENYTSCVLHKFICYIHVRWSIHSGLNSILKRWMLKLKNLIHYLREINLKPSWKRTGEQGRSCEVPLSL